MKSLILLLCLVAGVAALNHYEEGLFTAFSQIAHNKELNEEWKKAVEIQKDYKVPNWTFSCQTRNMSGNPKNVHELKPGDIDVIGALGDSVTAGNGINANIIFDVLLQVRGVSWSVGGDKSLEERVYTLANILRKYNPNLKGYSTGIGWDWEENSWLNKAIPGARAIDFPYQADQLLEKMKEDNRIDFNNDWKLITLFVGGNDLCRFCSNRNISSPQSYAGFYREALDKLHAEVPRALVQVVPMFDVSPIRHLSTGIICDVVHNIVCPCGIDDDSRPELRPVQLGYFIELQNLINSGRYDTRDDFTVVLQPYLRDLRPPRDPNTGEYDKSLFSPDCFHPNEKGHSYFAAGLWNQMFVKVPEKRPNVQIEEVTGMNCPKATDFIWTRLNSGNVHSTRR